MGERLVRFLWDLMPWPRRRSDGYGRVVPLRDEDHLRLQEAFTECAGHWVAIDRSTGNVVAVRETPYELSAYVKQEGIRGVDILRAPAESEPEVVGFG